MIFRPVFFVLILASLLPAALRAQMPLSNLRTKVVDARQVWQRLDSLSVAAPLVAAADSTTGQLIDLQYFRLQNNWLRTDTARLRAACPRCVRLRLTYRVLPFDLAAPVRRLDTAAIRRKLPGADDGYIGFDYTPFEPQKPLWQTSGLDVAGAYTRGLSFGNAQNLVFNSNLNLQLDGKIGNDLEIRAALSDNSVPLQPDGTTRQLKEFDRILIELKRKNTTLTAGDFDLVAPQNGHFLRYFKRVQGAMVESKGLKIKGKEDPSTLNLKTAATISRGKFNRQIIAGQEGNQGPYRLRGAENEQFIIVLAGTEKVFLDGLLLRRGLQDDYVMDYNLGELAFTPRRLITKDSRIIVEFEYAVQNYLRSTLSAGAEWRASRARLHLNIYSEQDSRTAGAAQDLSPEERRRLAEVGDALRDAYASGVDTLAEGFDADRVLYRWADTLVCGLPARALVYSTDPNLARYAARFSQVPQGQGNYVQVATAANGRVFRWVAPDAATCQPQGNFEPIVRLIAPEQRQMFTAGADFQVFKNTSITAEAALTTRDLNRFSPLNDGDNGALGAFLGFDHSIFTGKKNSGWQARAMGNYEFVARQFDPLNPYRNAEFARDWNFDPAAARADEHLAKGGFLLEKEKIGSLRYEYGTFVRHNLYDGGRHFGQIRWAQSGFDLFSELNLTQNEGAGEQSRFSRPKLDFSYSIKGKKTRGGAGLDPQFSGSNLQSPPADSSRASASDRAAFLKIGFYGEREKNERRDLATDTLNRAGLWYDLFRLYFQVPENQRGFSLGGSLQRRDDFFPTGQIFAQNTRAHEGNLNGSWQKTFSKPSKRPTAQASGSPAARSSSHQLTWNLTTRRLDIVASELTPLKAQNTYLGRVDYNWAALNNGLNLTTGYEIGSGQSPKTEFTYVAVNPGEGQFAWIDRNRDSVLQVDEMEIAVFQDQASYIRVAVTTPDFVRTNNVAFNQSLRLEPRLIFAGRRGGFRAFFGRFSAQSAVQTNRRVLAGAGGVSAWNPFELAVADSALVTVSSALRNAVFFNRANPKWDVSLAQTDNRNRLALTTGFESRRTADWAVHARVNLARHFSAEADASNGLKISDNEAFDSRDFDIGFWQIAPQLTWLPSRAFRAIFKIRRAESQNRLENTGGLNGGESARQTDWSAEITWSPKAKPGASTGFRAATSLRLKGSFADVRYDGQANNAVSYAMLEGLQDGRNFLWSLNLDRQLGKNMQMNFSYEGRKTGQQARVVHVGRAQVRAIF